MSLRNHVLGLKQISLLTLPRLNVFNLDLGTLDTSMPLLHLAIPLLRRHDMAQMGPLICAFNALIESQGRLES